MSNIGVLATIQGSTYKQFGKEILSTQIRFSMLRAMFQVDQEVQRKLDPGRRKEIRDFIIESLEKEEHFYFSPFIFSSRGGIKRVDEGFELAPGNKLYVLDGQHRIFALASAINSLQANKEQAEMEGDYREAEQLQQYIQSLEAYPVAMQIYLVLMLFHNVQKLTVLSVQELTDIMSLTSLKKGKDASHSAGYYQ